MRPEDVLPDVQVPEPESSNEGTTDAQQLVLDWLTENHLEPEIFRHEGDAVDVLIACPRKYEHSSENARETSIRIFADGQTNARCMHLSAGHNECQGLSNLVGDSGLAPAVRGLGARLAVLDFEDAPEPPTRTEQEQHEERDKKEERRRKAAERRRARYRAALTSVREMLTEPEEPREWVIEEFLPCAEKGMLVAAGGTGKGFLVLTLGVSVATGSPFCGFPVKRPQSVLVVGREDDRAEQKRRLRATLREAWPDLSDEAHEQLCSRLHIVDLVGESGALNDDHINDLCEVIREQEIALVILDPLGLFWCADWEPINSQEGAGQFHDALAAIVKRTGATVVVAHHVSKSSKRSGQELEAHASTGSEQLTSYSKFQMNLRSVKAKEMEGKNLHYLETHYPDARYIELAMPKTNVSAGLVRNLYFRKAKGGALVEVKPPSQEEMDLAPVYDVLAKADSPLTRIEWEKQCANLEDSIGKHRVHAAKMILIREGYVEELRQRAGKRWLTSTYTTTDKAEDFPRIDEDEDGFSDFDQADDDLEGL